MATRYRHKADIKNREATAPARISSVRNALSTATMPGAAQVSPDKPLTGKQKLFCEAYARGESVNNSIRAAGYGAGPNWGYRLLAMPNIQAYVAQEREKYAKASNMDRKKVIDMHLEAYEMAKLISEPAAMVSAAREIGKICGLYEPKKLDITLNGKVQHEVHRLEAMTDAELVELIERGLSPQQTRESPALAGPEDDDDDPE